MIWGCLLTSLLNAILAGLQSLRCLQQTMKRTLQTVGASCHGAFDVSLQMPRCFADKRAPRILLSAPAVHLLAVFAMLVFPGLHAMEPCCQVTTSALALCVAAAACAAPSSSSFLSSSARPARSISSTCTRTSTWSTRSHPVHGIRISMRLLVLLVAQASAMHEYGPPSDPQNSHFFPLDELQHSLQLAEPAVRLANQQRIRRLACITLAGYTPPSLHSLHQLSVVTSWLELDERVQHAEDLSRAWESVAALSDVPSLNSSFVATSACSEDSISSNELQRGVLPEGAQRTRTLCPPGINSPSSSSHGQGCPMQHTPRGWDTHGTSDPEDLLPLTELLEHPKTPPHLFNELADEVAPTLLECALDTLLVSDSDNATLDYRNGRPEQQDGLVTPTHLRPTRSI
eukprot:4630560-Amphidinium_carterae.2